MKGLKQIWTSEKFLFLGEQATISGLSFISTFLLARHLGLESFGHYAAMLLVAYMLLNISNALVTQPMQVSFHAFKGQEAYGQYSFLLLIVLGTIVLSFSFLLPQKVWTLLGIEASIIEAGSLFSIVFILFDFLRKWWLTAGMKTILIASTVSALIGHGIVFFYLFLSQANLCTTIYAMSFAMLPSVLIGGWVLMPRQLSVEKVSIYAKDTWMQAKWLLPSAVIQWWSSNFFIVSAGVIISPTVLGVFRLVQSIFGLVSILLQSYENYITPKAAALYQESSAIAATYIWKVSRKFLGSMFIAILLMVALWWPIEQTLGWTSPAMVYEIVCGMTVLYAFVFLNYPIRVLIRTSGSNHLFFHGYVISVIFSLLSFSYLLHQWGIYGALAGLIGSQFLMFIYWNYQIKRTLIV